MPPSQFDISWEALRNLPVVLPPEGEQRRIVDFLDDQLAVLDSLSAMGRRQVELSEEAMRTTMRQAMLGRDELGPRTEVRTSWIEKTPANWVVEPLRFSQ